MRMSSAFTFHDKTYGYSEKYDGPRIITDFACNHMSGSKKYEVPVTSFNKMMVPWYHPSLLLGLAGCFSLFDA